MKYSKFSGHSTHLNPVSIFHSAFSLLPIFVLIAVFQACSDGDRPEINGMWQLKTIQEENQNAQTVDTVFYSFQRQSIFSYTLLYEQEGKASTTVVIYGYIDFPEQNRLHIQADKDSRYYENALLPWNWGKEKPENDVTYDIIKLDSKKLVLFHDGKTYHFIKY
jgi:hypothetical protein